MRLRERCKFSQMSTRTERGMMQEGRKRHSGAGSQMSLRRGNGAEMTGVVTGEEEERLGSELQEDMRI